MKQRTADLGGATLLCGFSFLMLSQLDNVPVEGALFPRWTLYLILLSALLLGLRAVFLKSGSVSFFGEIPPKRCLVVCCIFLLQVLGSIYFSFMICMGVGMFLMAWFLTPCKNGKSALADLAFSAGLLIFFELFFTDVMKIYFPETLW